VSNINSRALNLKGGEAIGNGDLSLVQDFMTERRRRSLTRLYYYSLSGYEPVKILEEKIRRKGEGTNDENLLPRDRNGPKKGAYDMVEARNEKAMKRRKNKRNHAQEDDEPENSL